MIRYYEVDVDEKFKAESDFVYRRRNGTLWQTGLYYVIGIALVIALFMMDVHTRIGGIAAVITIVFIMGLLTVHSIISMQKHLDLVTSIEFQNALFSSAFREGKLFSLLISKEDQLYYADPRFYKLFPELMKNNSQVLDQLIGSDDASGEKIAALTHALQQREHITLDVQLSIDQESTLVRISVLPLPRPSGYFFVSARRYYISRQEETVPVSISAEEAEQLLGDLFTNKEEIAYLLDDKSDIIGCTQGLVSLLKAPSKHAVLHTNMTTYLEQSVQDKSEHFAKAAFHHEPLTLKNMRGDVITAHISHFYIYNHDNSPKLTLGKIMLERSVS
jgi:hypothetical protein